jgi:TonB-dependent starch-binding outer membrane protein SusC
LFEGGATNLTGAPNSTNVITNRFVSLYTNLAYTFKNRYVFSASARRDGSNIFGANTNDKWKPLWSIGVLWDISKEEFFKVDFLDVFKLRATYGYSGNVDLSRAAYPVATYFGGGAPTNFPSARIQTINNPDLRWEQVGMANVGLDFVIEGRMLSGSIEYYKKVCTDLYGPALIDYTGWGQSNTVIKNVANIESNGIDIFLNARILDRAFKWHTNYLFNYNLTKTTKYLNAENLTVLAAGGSTIIPIVGRPLYAIAAFEWGGLDAQGNPQGYLNGQLSTDYTAIFDEASKKGQSGGGFRYIGSTNPKYFGALINSFSWKHLRLEANISYALGYYFPKSTIDYGALVRLGRGHKDFERRWQNPGDEAFTNIPVFQYPINNERQSFFNVSEINVLKADHIRLQYINLSYEIPTSILKKEIFKSLSVYINAANLGILWRANDEKTDPDYLAIPPRKQFAAGVRVSF